MKYEIILFDVDDTLFNFGMSEEKALHNTFMKFGLPTGLADYWASYREISKVLWGDLEQGQITLQELAVERFKRLIHMHQLEIDAGELSNVYLEKLGKETHLIEGAVELCERLADYRLAVITNGFTAVQTARIENSPLHNTFEHIIMSEEAGAQKPDTKIFDYVFSKLQITDKSKVLIVGDSLTSDIQGGTNYGIDTCWFNPHTTENKLAIKPTFEIQNLMELVEIVEGELLRS